MQDSESLRKWAWSRIVAENEGHVGEGAGEPLRKKMVHNWIPKHEGTSRGDGNGRDHVHDKLSLLGLD